MMLNRKNTVTTMQIAMIVLILLIGISSFSCNKVLFFQSIAFFLPAIAHSASPICLFAPTIHLLLLLTSEQVPQTAYDLDNLGEMVAHKQLVIYAAFD